MSAFEQRVEPAQRQYQYLLVAAEPYETVAFKVQSKEIDRGEGRFWTHWDVDARQFSIQFFFKGERAPGMFDGDSGVGVRAPPPVASAAVVSGGSKVGF
ncbi:Splicing factor 3A subunit 2, partial [Physocladia obscura]